MIDLYALVGPILLCVMILTWIICTSIHAFARARTHRAILSRTPRPVPSPNLEPHGWAHNVTHVRRESDQSVTLVFTSCHQASRFEQFIHNRRTS